MKRVLTPFLAILLTLALAFGSTATASARGKVKKVYSVKKGDSLSKISRMLSVSQKQLRWWNPVLKHRNALRPGRQLNYFVVESEKKASKRPTLSIRRSARKDSKNDKRSNAASKVHEPKSSKAAAKSKATNKRKSSKAAAKSKATNKSKSSKAAAKSKATSKRKSSKAAKPKATSKSKSAKAAAKATRKSKSSKADKAQASKAAVKAKAPERVAKAGKESKASKPKASKVRPSEVAAANPKAEAARALRVKAQALQTRGSQVPATKLKAAKAPQADVDKPAPKASKASSKRTKPSGVPSPAAPTTAEVARDLGLSGQPKAGAKVEVSAARGIDLLQWMGRASRRMPSENPTPDLLLPGQSEARAEVIGSPNGGRLKNAVQLPLKGPGYRRINRSRTYACDQTIALIKLVGERLEERYPGSQPLLVGALSHENGGRAGGHRSHQNGLDVDIAYFEKGNPYRKHYKSRVRAADLDYEKNWFVFETLLLTGKVNYIFVDHRQLPHFREAARRAGWSEPALERLFGDENFNGGGRIIRHWKGHSYHAHIRFTCPRSDKRCEHSRY